MVLNQDQGPSDGVGGNEPHQHKQAGPAHRSSTNTQQQQHQPSTVGNVYNLHGVGVSPCSILRKVTSGQKAYELNLYRANRIIKKIYIFYVFMEL